MEGIIIRKKFEFDKKYLKIASYILAVILISILFDKILSNTSTIFNQVSISFSDVKKLAAPFIYGLSVAYLFNPIVSSVEKNLFSKINLFKKNQKIKRTFSIVVSYILVLGCITWLMAVFIPAIISSISSMFSTMPKDLASFESNLNQIIDSKYLQLPDSFWQEFEKAFEPLFSISKKIPLMLQSMLQTLLTSTFAAASTAINILLGLVISFYVLFGKEDFSKELKKILYAYFDEKKSNQFLYNLKRVNTMFQSFIVGKTIDSVIIGILCFLGLSLIKVDFILVISVIVGITNMIPYFGPFIGAIPAVFIVLLTMPSKAIWVALFIFALQQFDGIILGPKILGDSTGMNPIWIIFSIIIGGAIAGPVGMFIGVPICASIKMFMLEAIDRKYNKKYYYDRLEGEPPAANLYTKEEEPK